MIAVAWYQVVKCEHKISRSLWRYSVSCKPNSLDIWWSRKRISYIWICVVLLMVHSCISLWIPCSCVRDHIPMYHHQTQHRTCRLLNCNNSQIPPNYECAMLFVIFTIQTDNVIVGLESNHTTTTYGGKKHTKSAL